MNTFDPDAVVDLESIASIKRQLFRRWVPHYASLIVKFVPGAALCGFGLYWFLRWLNPGLAHASPLIFPLASGICALLICLGTLPAMIRLDFEINRRLTDMANRIAAGETVYASEVRTGRGSGEAKEKQSSPDTSPERTREE